MQFQPQVAKVDYLHYLIYLSKFYYSNKYVKLCTYLCLLLTACFYCELFYNLLFAIPRKVQWEDLLAAASFLQMLSAVVTLKYQKKLLQDFQQIRETYFWSNDLMNNQEKRLFTLSVNVVISLHIILWCLAFIVVFIYTACYGSFTSIMYDDNWSYFYKILHKIISSMFIAFAYFIGNTQVCYFAHYIVHGYLQMAILIAHFRQEMNKYRKIKLKNKIHSKVYQSEVKEILKRCISHYQKLKLYGSKISIPASKVSVLHFFSGVAVIAIGLNIVIFIDFKNRLHYFVSIAVLVHIGFGAMLYMFWCQVFFQTYENFYSAILKLDWYPLNLENQKLYYMLLAHSQIYPAVWLLPNLPANWALLTQFTKAIYSTLMLVNSMRNK